jgi:hypothetical protein
LGTCGFMLLMIIGRCACFIVVSSCKQRNIFRIDDYTIFVALYDCV